MRTLAWKLDDASLLVQCVCLRQEEHRGATRPGAYESQRDTCLAIHAEKMLKYTCVPPQRNHSINKEFTAFRMNKNTSRWRHQPQLVAMSNCATTAAKNFCDGLCSGSENIFGTDFFFFFFAKIVWFALKNSSFRLSFLFFWRPPSDNNIS